MPPLAAPIKLQRQAPQGPLDGRHSTKVE